MLSLGTLFRNIDLVDKSIFMWNTQLRIQVYYSFNKIILDRVTYGYSTMQVDPYA